VADLAGVNLFHGHAERDRVTLDDGGELIVPDAVAGDVFAAIHPRAIALLRAKPEGTPRNVWRGAIDEIDVVGPIARIRVSTVPPVVAEVTTAAVDALGLLPGHPASLPITPTHTLPHPHS